MKKYMVTAEATISIHCEVEAKSEREAIKLAQELPGMSFCHSCSTGNATEEWVTSGEIDGEPVNLRINK